MDALAKEAVVLGILPEGFREIIVMNDLSHNTKEIIKIICSAAYPVNPKHTFQALFRGLILDGCKLQKIITILDPDQGWNISYLYNEIPGDLVSTKQYWLKLIVDGVPGVTKNDTLLIWNH